MCFSLSFSNFEEMYTFTSVFPSRDVRRICSIASQSPVQKGQSSIINIGIALGYGHSFLVFDGGLRDPRGIWRKSVLFRDFAFVNKELETYKNV